MYIKLLQKLVSAESASLWESHFHLTSLQACTEVIPFRGWFQHSLLFACCWRRLILRICFSTASPSLILRFIRLWNHGTPWLSTFSPHLVVLRDSKVYAVMVLRIFGAKTGNGSRRPDSPILPTKSLSPRRSAVGFPKRYARLCFLLLSSLAVFSFFYGFDRTEKVLGLYRYPPRYEQYHEREATLPQHNLDLPYPEGRDAKYFWAANHVWSACLSWCLRATC